MKLGNKTDAQLIYRRRKTGYGPLPKGWKKLGEGSYRSCYLSPDKIVYKICHDPNDNSNEQEFNQYLRIKKRTKPRNWRVAKTKLYTFRYEDKLISIVAMEYVEGVHEAEWHNDDAPITVERAYDRFGLLDCHEYNYVLTNNKKRVIIDLGE